MAIETVFCQVIHATVTRVTNLEGEVERVMCPEYDETTRECRKKRSAEEGGPLAKLLEQADEGTLGTRGVQCHLV